MDNTPERSERVTINKAFESFEAFIHEYVTNISQSGALVRCQTPLPIGSVVDLKFTVLIDETLETITGTGRVVRVEHDPPSMGVVFTEVNEYSKQLIQRLLTLR